MGELGVGSGAEIGASGNGHGSPGVPNPHYVPPSVSTHSSKRGRRGSSDRGRHGSSGAGTPANLASYMGISGVVGVHEEHNWESARMPRSALPGATTSPSAAPASILSSGPEKDAIRRAVAQNASTSGGPPLLLVASGRQSTSSLQSSLQREASLGETVMRTAATWDTVQKLQHSTMPDELSAFCDAITEEDVGASQGDSGTVTDTGSGTVTAAEAR